jgi:hypothetical protein
MQLKITRLIYEIFSVLDWLEQFYIIGNGPDDQIINIIAWILKVF